MAAGLSNDRQTYTNGQLILRMLGLAWRFRVGAVKSLLLQIVLLTLALSGLSLAGLGIDVIREAFVEGARPAKWPFGIEPPDDWSGIARTGLVAGLVLAIAMARFGLDRTSQVHVGRLVQDIVVALRADVYHKLERLSFRFFDTNESGTIINRVTGDVQAVRAFIDQVLIQALMMTLSLTFFLIYMIGISPSLTFWCLLTTPVMIGLTIVFSRIVRPAYVRNRELYDQAVRVLAENAQGVHVVKGFALERDEEAKFAKSNDEVTRQQRWIFWRISFFSPLIGLMPQINLVILMVVGGHLFIQGRIDFGTGLFVFAGLLQQFSGQVAQITNVANTMQRSLTGAQRVFEVLDAPVEITSPPNAKALGRAEGRVSFEGVSFAYRDGLSALNEVSFSTQAGRCVAVVGATGSGKSTLLSLIPRFYDPTAGRVLIDGVDVREYDLDDLRRNIGIVFQESFLFSHTVAENIAFGHPTASRKQIEAAAAIAQADEFIHELPHGYDTVLSEAGGNLSGGQRQRLAIARAVLLEPPILLLDDPTAAIDPETEAEILSAMDAAMQGRTTFVVAHRLSTLRRADQVIVLEKGSVVERGTHDQLMAVDAGHYRSAADLQSADDESRRLLGLGVQP